MLARAYEFAGDLVFYLETYLEHLKNERGFSKYTLAARRVSLNFFKHWALDLQIYNIRQISKKEICAFEKHLYDYRKTTGEPLTFLTQRMRVSAVRLFFSRLHKTGKILQNPAADLAFPIRSKTLPRFILTEENARKLMSMPDINSILGIRDRAILEVFYSCGLRRGELINLCVYDIDFNKKILFVRKGKGQKDRVVPVGERALYWAGRYLENVRPIFLKDDTENLFLLTNGRTLGEHNPGLIVRKYMRKSGIKEQGSCHTFRHTMATHMLNNGAGIRYVQQMLGHEMLSTTQVYTRVAIEKLKEVHQRTFNFAYQEPSFELEPVKIPNKKVPKKKNPKLLTRPVLKEDLTNLEKLAKEHLKYLESKNYSQKTIANKASYLKRFCSWAKEQALDQVQNIKRADLEAYQKHCANLKVNDKLLALMSRRYMISHVASFFSWLSKSDYIIFNPAADLAMPKKVKSLPMDVLSDAEIEAIFSQPDLKTPQGLRDRAILEVFYSCGIRLLELCHLNISDIDFEAQTVFICEGKGKKDRYVPIGERALFWTRQYLENGRPYFAKQTDKEKDEGVLFLNRFGDSYSAGLNYHIKGILRRAGIKKAGSTILFRHSMATKMLENDADLRHIQSILGHESIETTKIYTHVAIGKLQEVHKKTHPAEKR